MQLQRGPGLAMPAGQYMARGHLAQAARRPRPSHSSPGSPVLQDVSWPGLRHLPWLPCDQRPILLLPGRGAPPALGPHLLWLSLSVPARGTRHADRARQAHGATSCR